MIYFNYIVLDMFRTTKCSSLRRLYQQLYGILSFICITVRLCCCIKHPITTHDSENIKFLGELTLEEARNLS